MFRSVKKHLFSCILLTFLVACNEDIYTQLDERQANEIVAVLYANGIAAQRSRSPDGLYSVRVSSSDLGAAIIYLDEADLPREHFQTLGQVFPADGVVGTAFEEHVRFIYALGQELSQTVSEIEGVDSARVHIMIPERGRLRDVVEPSRASVAVYRTEAFDAQTVIPSIKTLVAYAVPNLTYENVAVATFSAGGLEEIELTPIVPSGAAFAGGLFTSSVDSGPMSRGQLWTVFLGIASVLMLLLIVLQLMRGVSTAAGSIRNLFKRNS